MLALAAIGIVSLLSLILEHLIPAFPDQVHIYWLLGKLPYVLLVAVAFLGLQLNQTRILFVALLALLSYLLMRLAPVRALLDLDLATLTATLSVAVPLSWVGIMVIQEGRIVSPRGLLRAALCVVPLSLLLSAAGQGWMPLVRYAYYSPFPPDSWWQIPLLGVVITAASGLLLVLQHNRCGMYFGYSLTAGMVLFLFLLNKTAIAEAAHMHTHAPALGMSAITLLLGYAVYRTYWEKAYVDELTGVLNRRALNERIYRLGRHYAIAMIDIDHFKVFNDTYGHSQGDTVLRFIASQLERTFPGQTFRYGGEEFCVVYEGWTLMAAARAIEGVWHLVTAKDFHIRLPEQVRQHTSKEDRGSQIGSSVRIHLSFSAGVACRDATIHGPEDVIDMADRALYRAKEMGRGRVCCYDNVR